MGLPGDLVTHMEGAGFTAPYPERCAFTPIRTHTMYAHTVSGRSQGDMEAGSASIATPKGLESGVMGLPRDVATHIEVEGFTSSMSTCSSFTPYSNQHQSVNATFAQGCGEPCGSLAGFPWPRECSPISITLLLPSQETARSVNESPNTPPIQSMANPSKV